MEARTKTDLAAVRTPAPGWLPPAAGGHTEWFSAVHFDHAVQTLEAVALQSSPAQVLEAFGWIHGEITRRRVEFEHWAWYSAQQLAAPRAFANPVAKRAAAAALRDWLDAYQYCDILLFAEDPTVRRFVLTSSG